MSLPIQAVLWLYEFKIGKKTQTNKQTRKAKQKSNKQKFKTNPCNRFRFYREEKILSAKQYPSYPCYSKGFGTFKFLWSGQITSGKNTWYEFLEFSCGNMGPYRCVVVRDAVWGCTWDDWTPCVRAASSMEDKRSPALLVQGVVVSPQLATKQCSAASRHSPMLATMMKI